MSTAPAIPGVVVTYHPDEAFESRLRAVARETAPVLVVDNSTDPAARVRVASACATVGAELIANPANRGLATALNQAFARLAQRGFPAVIAFDQDSTPAPGFAAALQAVAAANRQPAVVGANWQDEARPGVVSRHLRSHPRLPGAFERVDATTDLADVTCVITSGSLFDLGIWTDLGGFDDDLFLDLVDTEYCLRARTSGHTIAVASAARLAHRRGAKRAVSRVGRAWWPAFMPPSRLRGLFRNRLHVVAHQGWRAPHWVAFEAAYTAKILAEILALEDEKWAKLGACVQGTWDGLIGRTGPVIRSPSTDGEE